MTCHFEEIWGIGLPAAAPPFQSEGKSAGLDIVSTLRSPNHRKKVGDFSNWKSGRTLRPGLREHSPKRLNRFLNNGTSATWRSQPLSVSPKINLRSRTVFSSNEASLLIG